MQQWFDPKTAGMIGGLIGIIIGLAGALIGCSSGICVRKGWKKAFYTIFISATTVGVGLLITGLVALYIKQPYHVWYCFMLPGFITTTISAGLFPVVRKRFTENELRQMQAKDL